MASGRRQLQRFRGQDPGAPGPLRLAVFARRGNYRNRAGLGLYPCLFQQPLENHASRAPQPWNPPSGTPFRNCAGRQSPRLAFSPARRGISRGHVCHPAWKKTVFPICVQEKEPTSRAGDAFRPPSLAHSRKPDVRRCTRYAVVLQRLGMPDCNMDPGPKPDIHTRDERIFGYLLPS
jgi:hypothetical protein